MRIVLLLLALFPTTATFAQTTDDPDRAEPVLTIAEQMPLFPGTTTKTESDDQMLRFVYGNVKYPETARDNKASGMAVISFVIGKDGRMSRLNIYRDPGSSLGAEAYHVARLMQDQLGPWTPAKNEGERVAVEFKLPVKFALSK